MKPRKQVTKEEFDNFIKDYPNKDKLEINIVRFVTPEVAEYNDFSLGKWPDCTVAQVSLGKGYYGMFETKEENDRVCIDEYFLIDNE